MIVHDVYTLSLRCIKLAQATEMMYMRLDTMNTTCVDR